MMRLKERQRLAAEATTRAELEFAVGSIRSYILSCWREVTTFERADRMARGIAAHARRMDDFAAVCAVKRGEDPFADIFATPAGAE